MSVGARANGCIAFYAMNRQLAQGLTSPSPEDSRNRTQQVENQTKNLMQAEIKYFHYFFRQWKQKFIGDGRCAYVHTVKTLVEKH